MSKVVTRTVFKNLITNSNGLLPDMVNFKNIKVNGVVRGCSGFLRYSNGNYVYVNTEPSCLSSLSDKILYRSAKNEKDFTGGENHYVKPSFKQKHDFDLQRLLAEVAYGRSMF
ncbi:MAG: hypothetical protein MJZ81_09225 [Bacteroidales bacterium]|nr:hypothetical protein [Bacteroidales bacterium]